MILTFSWKYKDQLIGLKKQVSTLVFEKHISLAKTHRDWISNDRKMMCLVSRSWSQEVALLIPDKVDFKLKLLRRDKEFHYILIKESRRHNDNKYICTNIHIQFHKINNTGHKEADRCRYSNSGLLQHSTHINK
jgi:hypothetical protein